MREQLFVSPLKAEDAWDLSKRIRQADLDDLIRHEADPLDSLLHGLLHGRAYGVWSSRGLIGAGGWTWEGCIWSLWANLTAAEGKGIMRNVAAWAWSLAFDADRPLWNVYAEGNRATEAFLKATHCVTIDKDHPLTYEGRTFIPFYLKSLGDLSNV
jgi:hypothetical protein